MTRKALWIFVGLVVALALVVIAPAARADEGDQASRLTFNQPVEIPGNVTLTAGTYWLVLPDDFNMPGIVQIFNADRTKLIATVHTIPTTRMSATDNSELTFGEQSRKEPIALISWFYPDRLTGHEFVYSPREEAKLQENEQVTVTVRTTA